jgi:hypothetical protein
LTNSHRTLQAVEAGHKSRGEAAFRAPDEGSGSTMGGDFAADSLQMQQAAICLFNY